MTTVPGFNLLIQQSGIVRDVNQSAGTPNPEPGHAAAEQVASEQAKKTVIQESEESEKLKADKEKEKNRGNEKKRTGAKEKKKPGEDDNDPDATGRLLDTIA